MFVPLCYGLICWLLEFTVLRVRSEAFKELEIVVLRHELAILRRSTHRPAITAADRVLLAAASRLLPRVRWRASSSRRRRCCAGIGVGRQAVEVRASRRAAADAA